MTPSLTIGMATFNDFDGCYFTIQALRMYHPEVEIVVVDNNPTGPHSSMLQTTCAMSETKYTPLHTPVGTSPSRNKVFEVATGDFVLCVDSHVLLQRDSVARLLRDIEDGYIGNNIYSGPMIMDTHKAWTTHFIPEWRAEMFGIWGRAWQCPCGRIFSSYQKENRLKAIEILTCDPATIFTECSCGKKIPDIGWDGHEAVLTQQSFTFPDRHFEIPGQGLGCFGAYKAAWPGFVEGAIGFGGEELNIHEVFRQRGDKAICLPYLGWLHKFGRPGGVPYPLQKFHKVRNSILWHRRLGKPLDDIHHHFVATRLIPPEHWVYLLQDPLNHTSPPLDNPQPCQSCGGGNVAGTVEEVYQKFSKIPRDFDQHMSKLRELADRCKTVTDISIRQESFFALAASKAENVYSYSSEANAWTEHILSQRKGALRKTLDPSQLVEIGETDLLFLNTKHHGPQVLQELTRFAPKTTHYIVIHNSVIYGELGEGHSETTPVPGILPAIRAYCRQDPRWSVVYHTADQYGLTVLSCHKEDKKRLPGIARQALNFAKALTEHIADGGTKADLPVMENRLNICSGCEHRVDGSCTVCGCVLAEKASWRSSECPLGLWPSSLP